MMVSLRLLAHDADHPEAVVSRVAELKRMASDVLEGLHRLAVDLRPASLDHVGLPAALHQFVQTFGRQHDLKIQFMAVGLEGERLTAETETALYRIVQEALTNVARHARASKTDVILERRGDRVVAIVEDDGTGFDPEAFVQSDRLGLLGIRERVEMLGGTLAIESEIGKGTTVLVEVPCGHSYSSG
jgi:signal transduction histidine kinase